MTASAPLNFRLGLLLALMLAAPAFGQANAIVITPDSFGVANAYRAGEVTGLRLALEPSAEAGLDEAAQIWVQWEVPNVDGDVAEYGRPVTVTRGREVKTWLYAPLAPDAGPNSQWIVRAFAYDDGERGRELGGLRIRPPGGTEVPPDAAVLGVIGSGPVGLNQYQLGRTGRGPAATAHEETRVVSGIRPSDLTDRWEGLRLFDALVWTDMPPQDLPTAQLEALREWMRRGGHLVIVLPDTGNAWGLGEDGRTGLHALLPTRKPRLDDAVPLGELMPVLAKTDRLRDDVSMTLPVHVFGDLGRGLDRDDDAIDNRYEPLVALPDGRVVAVQRILGHGRITLLGIDISTRQFATVPLDDGRQIALPQADVLWNRILGRRQDTPTADELVAIEGAERLNPRSPREMMIGTGGLFLDQIGHEGKAGTGLLVALVLFIVYWLVAGPLGFGILKRFRQTRHAWLAFAGAAGIFTAIAWLAVAGLRERQVVARHVTYLDYVARPDGVVDEQDPQLARAASWMSVYVPGYRPRSIDIASDEPFGVVPAQRDLLYSWSPPGRAIAPFPNVDRYAVDVRVEPDSFVLPTRSTATLLEAHWLGSLGQGWDMIRVDPDDPLRVRVDRNGVERLEGSLVNRLPGELKDVQLIWVQNRREPPRAYAGELDGPESRWVRETLSGSMLNTGRAASWGAWGPGEIRKLAFQDDFLSLLEQNLWKTYVQALEDSDALGGAMPAPTTAQQNDFMEMLGFVDMLRPPTYLRSPAAQGSPAVAFRRVMGRELDLSAWFNRPCLIVIGRLEGASTPVPLRMDGQPVDSEGRVLVRWVCPLPVEPRVAFGRAGDE